MKIKSFALAGVAAIVAVPAVAQDRPVPAAQLVRQVDIPYQQFTLPNGLRVLSWQVREGGKPHGIWVLSTSSAADAFFQGALSMQLAK